jgi:diaminopropionate ammonia-lyase
MTTLPHFACRHVINRLALKDAFFGGRTAAILGDEAFAAAKREITAWPGYAPTPLVPLAGLAAALGLDALHYKDEGQRFGLKSFKALGGAYAVLKVLSRKLAHRGIEISGVTDLLTGGYREATSEITVCCATDGNHGRSVAWAAQMFGCACVIYLHEGVSQGREDEIAAYGARIRRVPGGYDESVRVTVAEAAENGWFVVSDTAWQGYEEVPGWVMQGYNVMADEIAGQWPDWNARPPSHLFIQGGVGGLAGGVAWHLWRLAGAGRPRTVVVEPERADCIARSMAAGEPTAVPGDVETFMACLAAAEMSPLAWEILKDCADETLVIPDEAAAETMRLLAAGTDGDRPIVAGESGAAATAALIAACGDGAVRDSLGLGPESRVLVIGSEGATDRDIYLQTVGKTPEEVAAAA